MSLPRKRESRPSQILPLANSMQLSHPRHSGNPVKVRLDVPVASFLEEVAEAGLGHHWMIGEGDAIPALLEFGRLTGIPVFEPGLRGT